MTNGYQIAAVARRTGLSTDTIRAWERRYSFVQPLRSASGIRVYSEGDVARLELARAAVSLGHPIRRVAQLSDSDLRSLIETVARPSGRRGLRSAATRAAIEEMLDAIRDYDLNRAESLLNSAALLFPAMDLVVEILTPLMHEIGALWEERALSIAQEHFASNLIRSLLGSMMRLRPPNGNETMLFFTPPGEAHEFGILFAACIASLHGIRALVLGANIPASEVARVARRVAPTRLVVGLVYADNVALHAQYLAELRKEIPDHIRITLGGKAATAIPPAEIAEGVNVITDLSLFADDIRNRKR
ncbi:MAG: B12-binding domain-containing protein [Candidatus Baltobacteraceae bacterium]